VTPAPRTVWLASYPKSGNTWVRAMMAALDHGHVGLNTTIRRSIIASARGPLERLTGLASTELLLEEVQALRPLVDAQLDQRFDLQGRKFWHRKIHDALFTAGGDPIVSPAATHAAIYVVRDPRDVAVSFAHHMGSDVATIVGSMGDRTAHLSGPHGSTSTQLSQFVGSWSTHVEGWLDHELFPVLLVRYEDMLADPLEQLANIARTLGRDVTPEELTAAVEAASFDKLKAQETETGFRESTSPGRAFFRRGIAGGWRDDLPAELVAQIESDHRRVMTRLGYLTAEPASDANANLQPSGP